MSLLGLEALSLGGLTINVLGGFCTEACKKQINRWLQHENHDVPHCLREAWRLTLTDAVNEAIQAHKSKLSSGAEDRIRSAAISLTTKEACERLFPADLTFASRELLGMPGHNDPALVADAGKKLVDAFAIEFAALAPAQPPLPEPFLAHMRENIFVPFSRYFIEIAFKHDPAARAELQLQFTRWYTELLRSIKGDTAHTRTQVDEIHDAVVRGNRPSPSVTDNLAAAGAVPNPQFVGRTIQLDTLASLINDRQGPPAVVIVAGAGFGKTELAKAFINTRARPAPPSADLAALAPDQWTARWWLDGSLSGEEASLRMHYAAITGRPYPDEPRPGPDEDAAAVMTAFRNSLRRSIAQACSTGQQLLVLDNAETPEQIAHYRPANAGRLIATTRRQPIPRATAREFPLDVMSPEDARLLLAGARDDLNDPRHAAALDAIAAEVGHHALGLAYAAAALARPPHKSPETILQNIRRTDVGDEASILGEFTEEDLGGTSPRSLAQSLGLLLDELADPDSRTHDPLASSLAEAAAFCAPDAIPIGLLASACGAAIGAAEKSLRALHERSILILTDKVSIHRLTQSLLRGRVKRRGDEARSEAGGCLLAALFDLFKWPEALTDQLTDHAKTPARIEALAHAEVVLAQIRPTAIAARLRTELARRLLELGQLTAAMQHIERSIDWEETQIPRNERDLAIRYASRASIRLSSGDLNGAEEDIAHSIVWGKAQSPCDERSLADWYASLASIQLLCGDPQRAAKHIAHSIAWGENQIPRDERTLAIWYAWRASIREDCGDLRGAEEDIERSIAWGKAQIPRNGRSLAINYSRRAHIRQSCGNLQGAVEDIECSITWEEAQIPRNERGLAILYASRAGIRQNRGDLKGADEDINRSIAWGEAQSPRSERGLSFFYATRADIRHLSGDLKGAEEDIARSIAWGEAQTPRDARSLAIRYASRASIRRAQATKASDEGDTAAAKSLFTSARIDIDKALNWWLVNLPNDALTISNLHKVKTDIDKAECGE